MGTLGICPAIGIAALVLFGTTLAAILPADHSALAISEYDVVIQPDALDNPAEAFSPNLLQISVGDSVRLRNNDDTTHAIVGGTPSNPGAEFGGTTENPIWLNHNDSFSHIFNGAGEYPYYCILHPQMTGRIIVGSGSDPQDQPLLGKITFASYRAYYSIYTMNPDGTDIENLTDDSAYDVFPSLSSDGTKIAFSSSRHNTPQEIETGTEVVQIYVMNADGTGLERLTYTEYHNFHPSWSPDGTKIAFSTQSVDGDTSYHNEIYVINVDKTGLTQLTNNDHNDSEPSWSPDGTKIAFTSNRDATNEVYVMNADGSAQTRLTFYPASGSDPSWSPDGTKIAFESFRDGNSEIYVMNADGTNQKRLTTNPSFDGDPSWSPDGTKIAFASNRDGKQQVYVMNADGTGQTRVSDLTGNDYNPSWGGISDDGSASENTLTITTSKSTYVSGEELTYYVNVGVVTADVLKVELYDPTGTFVSGEEGVINQNEHYGGGTGLLGSEGTYTLIATYGSTSASTTFQVSAAAPSGDYDIEIVSGAWNKSTDAYSPNTLVIGVGEEVVWQNNDTTLHTVVGGDPSAGPSSDPSKQLGHQNGNPIFLNPDDQLTVSFDIPGEYLYYCMLHPQMTGKIIVVGDSSVTPMTMIADKPSYRSGELVSFEVSPVVAGSDLRVEILDPDGNLNGSLTAPVYESHGGKISGGVLVAGKPGAYKAVAYHSGSTASTTFQILPRQIEIVQDAINRSTDAYSPNILRIEVGEHVEWINKDSHTHTVVGGTAADGPSSDLDKRIGYYNDEPLLVTPGGGLTGIFTKEGEYPYYCMLHPQMVGKVIVGSSSNDSSSNYVNAYLEITPGPPVVAGEPSTLKVTFRTSDYEVQPHIDYNIKILVDDKKTIFDAAEEVGQPALHTAEGAVTMPYTFADPAQYTVQIIVTGILFVPVEPQESDWVVFVQQKPSDNASDAGKTSSSAQDSSSQIMPNPRLQLRAGVPPEEITCREGYELVISPKGKPFCATPSSAERLRMLWDL